MQISRRQSFVPWHFCQYSAHALSRNGEGNGVGLNYYFDRYIFFLEIRSLQFAARLLTDVTTVQRGLREPLLLSLTRCFGSVTVRGAN